MIRFENRRIIRIVAIGTNDIEIPVAIHVLHFHIDGTPGGFESQYPFCLKCSISFIEVEINSFIRIGHQHDDIW